MHSILGLLAAALLIWVGASAAQMFCTWRDLYDDFGYARYEIKIRMRQQAVRLAFKIGAIVLTSSLLYRWL